MTMSGHSSVVFNHLHTLVSLWRHASELDGKMVQTQIGVNPVDNMMDWKNKGCLEFFSPLFKRVTHLNFWLGSASYFTTKNPSDQSQMEDRSLLCLLLYQFSFPPPSLPFRMSLSCSHSRKAEKGWTKTHNEARKRGGGKERRKMKVMQCTVCSWPISCLQTVSGQIKVLHANTLISPDDSSITAPPVWCSVSLSSVLCILQHFYAKFQTNCLVNSKLNNVRLYTCQLGDKYR